MHIVRPSLQRRPRGFTLIELLVVVAIMGLLAAFTMMGFRYANLATKRSLTQGFQRSIDGGLERYFTDNGEYPEPRVDREVKELDKLTFNVAGAKMLYQALSGDGNSEIKLGSGGGRQSDGEWLPMEIPERKMVDMPKEIWSRDGQDYFIVDGFKHPYQYDKAPAPTRQNGQLVQSNKSETINNTYDLYSFSDDDQNVGTMVTLSMKQDVSVSGRWIRNW
jgi:prepilin-type N-terminal cleavage/methylation domain-containing protein